MSDLKDVRVFGTDGIRGVANYEPIVPSTLLKIAMAVAHYLSQINSRMLTKKILIGKDTRRSCYMIESVLVAGFTSLGYDVILLGPIPTAGVSMLVQSMRADLGVMISASHNPYNDNGLKFFNYNGQKLTDEMQHSIENYLSKSFVSELVHDENIGRVTRLKECHGRYIEYIKSTINKDVFFSNLKIVLDCANGASYKIAPIIFEELGFNLVVLNDEPNGFNINQNCGAVYTAQLQKAVVDHDADLGIAFDGDADRVIMVDENGELIDGDKLLAFLAVNLKQQQCLNSNTVVATYFSNLALENFLASHSIKVHRVNVGDRYIYEKLSTNCLNLGGEPSGHIILRDYSNSGDGILVGLHVLLYLNRNKMLASSISALYDNVPSKIINIGFTNESPLSKQEFVDLLDGFTAQYHSKLRILVRQSGTERLIRVLIESKDLDLIEVIEAELTRYHQAY